MNLSKKQQKDVQIIYNNFWVSYLSGDIESMGLLLADDFNVIGSTTGEVFRNKEEVLKYYNDTAYQIKNKLEFRNRNVELVNYDQFVLFNEHSDAYILINNDWTFYAKVRLSSILKNEKNEWKFVQQHGSIPDSKAGDGEQIAFKKISKENLELRDAIKRRTIELENKSRELEIEAALERIRTIAMSMQKAEDLLEVVKTLNLELKTLGFTNIRNTIINIFDDAREVFTNYDYSDYGVGGISEVGFYSHPSNTKFVNKIREGSTDFMITEFTDKELDEWKKWRSDEGQMPDSKLDQARSLYYYEYSIGIGSIGISTFSPINEDQLEILKKIRNVFDLAYRRYTDITIAEAHAREAQIEAALEKVRSSALTMKVPEDMLEVCRIISGQLETLGVKEIRNVQTAIIYESKGTYINYEYFRMHDKALITEVDYSVHPKQAEFANQMLKSPDSFFTASFEGAELKKWLKNQGKTGQYVDSHLEKANSVNYYFHSTGPVALGLSTYSPLSNDDLKIFKRFRNVFELAYKRFNDIEKAEAQAREAEIELAMERVRARTMAMQNSDELPEAANLLFQQVQSLGMPAWSAGYCIWDDDKQAITLSMSSEGVIQPSLRMPLTEDPTLKHFLEAHLEGKSFFVEEVGGEILKEHYIYLKTLPGVKDSLEEIEKAGYPVPTFQINHCAYFSKGFLLFITYEPVLEAHDIFKRFAGVYEQTYTRFLDLQRAEVQAREAEIELALEKVRSRSIGMQKSDELKDVIKIIFDQLILLNINAEHAGIVVDYTPKGDWNFWIAETQDIPARVSIPYLDNVWDRQFTEAKEKGKEFFSIHLDFEEKNSFYQELLEYIPDLTKKARNFYFKCPGLAISTVIQKDIGLYMENFSGSPYSDEENDTLMRFGKVFQQTYTRFLDLQKAEAQAREAQIEAALERVRSRSMAMHNSEELSATAEVLFEQINLLGNIPDRMSIGIINEKRKNVELWVTDQGGNKLSHEFFFSLDEPTSIVKLYNAWKERKDSFIVDLTGQNLADWLQFVKENAKLPIDETQIIGRRVQQAAFFSQGFLLLTSHNPVDDEIMNLLVRFAKVFEQTYTRFLDLQKVEEQAREAQIEAALERVRSKTMAMHNSHDVGATVVTLFEEVLKLGLDNSIRCGIGILNKETDHMETWSATSDSKGEVDLKMGLLDMTIHPMLIGLKKAWQKGETWYSYDYIGDDVIKYYDALNKEPEYPFIRDLNTLPENEYHKSFFYPEGILFSFAPNPISDEAAKVLNRFASVFGQTYRRYLDLLKAEAQAREAQIEAALERVRARTMAMQKSNELAQTTAHLFDQLSELGIKPYRCNIAIVDQGNDQCQLWSTTNHGNVIPVGTSIPLLENTVFEEMYDGWKTKRTGHVIKLVGNDRITWTEYISKYVYFDEYKTLNVDKKKLLNEPAIFSNCYFKQGFFVIHTVEEVSETDLNIIQRFAHVFEQTYTRFLDLENAEVQNKLIQEENERKTEELEEARKIQLAMLPKELPKLPGVEIAVYMETATEVGGDYYDFHAEEDGTLTAVIGDATGHGMKAGTIVTVTKSLFNSLASDESILDTFKKISRVIKDMKFRQLSMCLMMIKLKENHLMLSSAAMPPALIYRKKNKSVEELLIKGMPLGAMINFPYSTEETNLERGDTILLMSDGFPELQNGEGEMYGYERTRTTLGSIGDKKPEEIVNHLKNSATEWLDGLDADDDVTFVVIKIK